MAALIKTFNYGKTPNTYDIFKALALLTMVIDHIGSFLYPDELWFRVFGRIAFPVFLFLVGYSGIFRFNTWLLCGAAAVLTSAALTGHTMLPLNILFSIALWRVFMGYLTTRTRAFDEAFMLWVAMLVFHPVANLFLEYGTLGLMFAVLGWYTRQGRNGEGAVRSVWLSTMLFWGVFQSWAFGFGMAHIVVFAVETMVLTLAMMQFQMREVPLLPGHAVPSPTVAERLVIFLARNTLALYVLHVIALQITVRLLRPEEFSEMFMLMKMG